MLNFWQNPKVRALIYQLGSFVLLLSVFYFLFSNTQENLKNQDIASGFQFFEQESGFEISESLISYSSEATYLRALIVGLFNTIKVSIIGNFWAIILGVGVGLATLSKNFLLSKMAKTYVEVIRNVPLLLQLFFWYSLFTEIFPSVRNALSPFKGFYFSNRGVFFPWPKEHPAFIFVLISLLMGPIIFYFLYKWARKRLDESGELFPVFKVGISIFIGFPLLVWLIGGAPRELNIPVLEGFNFEGGKTITPEFTALLLGLALYTSAFIGEIVRAGILSVNKGQWEAAQSLGLGPVLTMRLVILPQALRVIIPPLTSQLLNLTKNSSLAVAIAYPDFVSIAQTTLNQTGQSIEPIGLIIMVYLALSLLTSLIMNWYDKKMALVER